MADNVDISILTERLSAQTEVHLKYTEAFVRIIGILDELKMHATSSAGVDQEHFRLLLERHIILIEQVKALAESSKAQSSQTQDLIEALEKALAAQHSEHQEDLREQFESVKKMIVKKDNELTLLAHKILSSSQSLSDKLDAVASQGDSHTQAISQLESKMDQVVTTVKSLDKYNSGWQSTWKQWRAYVVIFFVIIGIAETLVQLGVLHLTWGGK